MINNEALALKELFTSITGECKISTSCVTIKRLGYNDGKGLFCSYAVSAESHLTYIYPNDKLELAIQRFLHIRGKTSDFYNAKEHAQYVVESEDF